MMSQPSPSARTSIKLHRNVALIHTEDPLVVEELMARKPLARLIAGRLSETVLLVRPEDEAALLEELRRMGHAPRVVR
jgi:hypothetical protein